MRTGDPHRIDNATEVHAHGLVDPAYVAAWGSVDAPMGGMKASGLGRRHGEHGILEYTESQSTAVEPALPAGAPDGVDPGRYARLASAGLKILKHLPGIK